MLVSAVSANSFQTIKKKVNSKGVDNYTEIFNNSLNPIAKTLVRNDKAELFDSINEWKYFCHAQIAKGKLDIIA